MLEVGLLDSRPASWLYGVRLSFYYIFEETTKYEAHSNSSIISHLY